MRILLIEYSNRTDPKNPMPDIGENSTEDSLCSAFDKLNVATLNELLSEMEQLFDEFKAIHEQLAQCEQPSLEYAYTMGDLYGLVLGMSGQYQAVSEVVSKLPARLLTETLRARVSEGKAILKQVIQAWNELEVFFTDEVGAFRDMFYEVTADGPVSREEKDSEMGKDGTGKPSAEQCPFNKEQMQWLREELAKMSTQLFRHDAE